jgi:hypothetical protein
MNPTTGPTELTDDEIEIDDVERACMAGHSEARDRLEALGWTDEQIEELEEAAHSYHDFARCVIDEIHWRREHDLE